VDESPKIRRATQGVHTPRRGRGIRGKSTKEKGKESAEKVGINRKKKKEKWEDK